MNLKIAKAYRKTSNEALCILTGITPIEIKAKETTNLYRIIRDSQNHQLDHEVKLKDWTHPADSQSQLMRKMKQMNTRFKYSQMEASMNMELDQEPLYTYRTS